MAKVMSLRQALKMWGFILATLVLLFVAGQITDGVVNDPHASTGARWGSVLLTVVSLIPWVLVIAWSVSVADEFHRYVALVGTAIAFAADVVLRSGVDVMHHAHLIAPTTNLSPLPTAIGLWVVCIALTVVYFHLRP